jgi:hypothetical protein
MADKKFENIDILKELAASMPTQRAPAPITITAPAATRPSTPITITAPARPVQAGQDEQVQISFSARASTRKGMFKVAHDLDVTLKALILGALRDKYPQLGITDDDLADMRTRRR